ncbi:hypothetical protein DICPUDRAFT_156039 [Dictyostelium purpureum]|uniref:Uncharacterized protein n=1 Tax=Dictyostelium purpureum TaxID=5786 RepID=F0ZVJ2_DICPU|nr:uncharacterized protein DICPUDRAFT_156039 [Dictyostelium purpureum]EGC32045.1 hypothetical protein DICPUDRAFT_156039 [Dictyostelium purpureum]|eukprot:XP_003291431.1 hypothetical protein DICPUDRAFT_156039 [Dictyostelium purpureum]
MLCYGSSIIIDDHHHEYKLLENGNVNIKDQEDEENSVHEIDWHYKSTTVYCFVIILGG